MTLTNHDIEQLLMLCKKGNQQAQMEIYNRYYKAMYNSSFRIVKDKFEAEDIMQESFLTAFTKLNSLKDISTFGAWLKRIVINNSIYHYNKNKGKAEDPIDDKLYKMAIVESEKSNETEACRKARMVVNKIQGLKDNYRMGLTLHLIEGYDYEEISDIMNITYGNCRTMISRAKESLRHKLEPIINF